MNGLQIQYFLGLFFALNTIRFEGGKINADLAQVVIGLLLVVTAVVGATLLK